MFSSCGKSSPYNVKNSSRRRNPVASRYRVYSAAPLPLDLPADRKLFTEADLDDDDNEYSSEVLYILNDCLCSAFISLFTTGPLTMEEYTGMMNCYRDAGVYGGICNGGIVATHKASSGITAAKASSEEDRDTPLAASTRIANMKRSFRGRAPELSVRAAHMLSIKDSATDNYKEVYENQYDPVKNPKGKINLCTAENNICEDLLDAKLKNLELWKPEFGHLYHYPAPGGFDRTKAVLIPYFEKFMKAKNLQKENIILTPSVTTSYDMLAFTLCDPGEFIICPAPYYGRITNDFGERGKTDVISVPFSDPSNPKLEVSAFQKVYEESIAKGAAIKAMVLVNPQNPHGTVFKKKELIELCDWATDHKIVVAIDEIFASSVYRDEAQFESFLSFRKSVKKPSNVIWIWGFSKDLCMPGLKFSVIHCENERLIKCFRRLEIMASCSPLVQDFAVNFLSDLEWLQEFHKENIKRLAQHCEIAKLALKKIGIPFIECSAGFYLYCDFREYLTARTYEAEYAFWRQLCDEGVYLSPGKFFADPEPGWMRLVFSCDKKTLAEGISRIGTALKRIGKRAQKIPN